MKKYVQITVIVAVFFILVLMTRLKAIQPPAQTASPGPVGTLAPTTTPLAPASPAPTLPTAAVASIMPTPTPAPTSEVPTPTASPTSLPKPGYIDGVYTHKPIEIHGGLLQLQVTFAGGRMEDITFVEYPHASNTSQVINEKVLPRLRAKALKNQRAQIDFISGASNTSNAFDWALRAIVRRATPGA